MTSPTISKVTKTHPFQTPNPAKARHIHNGGNRRKTHLKEEDHPHQNNRNRMLPPSLERRRHAAYCTKVVSRTIFAPTLPRVNRQQAGAPMFLMSSAGEITPGPYGQYRLRFIERSGLVVEDSSEFLICDGLGEPRIELSLSCVAKKRSIGGGGAWKKRKRKVKWVK